ncbi:hypothetical protein CKO28_24565 [Rhodovibrio sodomensis]|uniref:Recombinase family protein n=2 Tax=Rhodovibrio sodomensis TaxID=1088 RepID=A0ABS1DME6_9PROT|nr:hypothetical protein [Rhodovibrio sodomensis]
MTRVTKGSGAKAGKPYLVCVKAKGGAGCTYRAVTLADVERAIVDDADFLVGTATSGDHDLDGQLEALEGTLDAIREQIGNVVEALSHGASAALSERLRALEAEADAKEAERVTLLERVEAAYKPFVEQRLGELETALHADPIDKQAANAAMRRLFERVTVDYPRGKLVFAWKNGAVSEIVFAFPDT